MTAFIQISKTVRSRYQKEIPFVAAMCKQPQLKDVQLHITKYMEFKSNSLKAKKP